MGRSRYQRSVLWIFLAIVSATIAAGTLGFISTTGAVAQTTGGEVGERDESFDAPGNSTTPPAPSGDKPQSKLWFNDGTWWGSLFDNSPDPGEDTSGEFHIFRFDWETRDWVDTGTPLDTRNTSKADVLWDGEYLYVATAVPSSKTADPNAYLLRYSYDAATKTYTPDQDFPVVVGPVTAGVNGGIEAIVLDKDSTGKLWVTFTQRDAQGNNQVYVNHSLDDDATWGAPFVLQPEGLPAGATSVNADDISAVIAFDSKIGVMWSNQNDNTMYFATHEDGAPDNAWQGSIAARGAGYADDHINLKSLQADPSGRVFAAVKTSLDDAEIPDPEAPLIWLLVLGADGNWKPPVVFGKVKDEHTRPIVMVDQTNRKLYMFATAPVTGGGIYYKQASLSDNITFPEGRGTPFIQGGSGTFVNNASSTKQNLNSSTGLLILASDDKNDYYWHNVLDLIDSTAPEVALTAPADGTAVRGDATLSADASDKELVDRVEFLVNGTVVGTDREAPYSMNWNSTSIADGSVAISARAFDAAGNEKTSTSRTVAVDNTGPETTIASGPDGPANDPTFEFESNEDGSTFECSLDGENYEACASGDSFGPLGDGEHTFYVRALDAAGNTGAAARRDFTVDNTAPEAQPPAQSFVVSSKLGASTVPIKLDWSATDAGSGVARYELQQSTNGGAYTGVALPAVTATTTTLSLNPDGNYRFRVRAQDKAGNLGAWAEGSSFTVKAYQENTRPPVTYPTTGWTRTALSESYGGYVAYAKRADARVKLSFTGRGVAWVAPKSSTRGKAEVWIDGAYVTTVDLYSSSTLARQVVFSQSWASSGSHRLEIKVLGTTNRPRVDVDAFAVLQ